MSNENKGGYNVLEDVKDKFKQATDTEIEPFDSKKHLIRAEIYDTMKDAKTETLLHDCRGMTKLEKTKVLNVLKYCAKHFGGNNNIFDKLVLESNNIDQIKSKIQGCYSDECLMMYAVLIYHVFPHSLLMETVSTHTRVMPFTEGPDEWFSNFTLDSYLLQMNTFVYSEYDDQKDTSIYSFKPIDNLQKINKNVKLLNPKHLLEFFGTRYRVFTDLGESAEDKFNNVNDVEATEMLDKINEIHPFTTGLAHGCDCFWINNKSPTIHEIESYCLRYPQTTVGYILNTKSYKSGKGQHWLAVMFMGRKCIMMCSQGSDFSVFDIQDVIKKELDTYEFIKDYNQTTIQHDPSSCGMYSVLSLLCSLIYKHSHDGKIVIEDVIKNMIGENAQGINAKGGIYAIKKKLCGFNTVDSLKL